MENNGKLLEYVAGTNPARSWMAGAVIGLCRLARVDVGPQIVAGHCAANGTFDGDYIFGRDNPITKNPVPHVLLLDGPRSDASHKARELRLTACRLDCPFNGG
jgi:hypothetical protein